MAGVVEPSRPILVVMGADAAEHEVGAVIALGQTTGCQTLISYTQGETRVGLLAGPQPSVGSLEILPGVVRVERLSSAYPLASRAFHREDRIVELANGVRIGGTGEPVMIGGPCAVESEAHVEAAAQTIISAGGRVLRGGAYKPRTSPYSFHGLGHRGLEILRATADRHGLAVVTEVLSAEDVPLVAEHAEMLQIGARNMQNYPLLRAAGRSGRPVLLKRGIAATIDELLLAAEYILAEGNPDVVLCERGIRTYETSTRFTLDINAIPVLASKSSLPVIVDPSHATGRRDWVAPVALAAIAAGAHGLIVEMHPKPEEALCDGPQALLPEGYRELAETVARVAEAVRPRLAVPA